ncbi:hypothetical protein Tdes44962_MAKER03633 [Teratosphaeria destructans]|uniref:Uncharacterized protein n=1 Tax=Teratosphaeria destructans TaxID=418781 RepID=A0A9W7SPC9_9PEZI|nr:hypothetical protein Tdes44962_MAKER03633 [Teratosphaeria destructans]
MYVESKPLSTYGATPGWAMPRQPSPQPPGTLRRPPVLKSGSVSSLASSASSLSGMEQSIPSFRSFVSRTPTPESHKSHKPLPPTPLSPRRASSTGRTDSQAPSSLAPRRTSSIYSHALSEGTRELSEAPSTRSWQTNDLGDQSNLLLRPIAYSASTSQLVETRKQPALLEPRTYSPLITTPSPTASTTSTTSLLGSEPEPDVPSDRLVEVETRPSILLPAPAALAHIPKKHLRTVSLEKAKEIMQAPGKEHLLPEELRNQTIGRVRSQDPPLRSAGHRRLDSIEGIRGKIPSEIPEAPTLKDSQGRERLIVSPRNSQALVESTEFSFPVTENTSPKRRSSSNPFLLDKGRAKLRASQMHGRQRSNGKNLPVLTIDTGEEPRGRTKVRGQRNSKESNLTTQREPSQNSSIPEEGDPDFATEYYELLNDAYRNQSSSSAAPPRRDSSTEVVAKMKMIPQPLFHSKPAASGTIRQEGSGVSPSHGRSDSGHTTFGRSKHGSSDSRGTLPLRLSLSLRPGFKRTSTSGDIPISPPPDKIPPIGFPRAMSVEAPKVDASPKRKDTKSRRRSSEKKSLGLSMSRKSKKENRSKGKGKGGPGQESVPRPLMAADIVAEKLQSSAASGNLSPLRSNPPVPSPPGSDASSIRSTDSRRPLHQRMLKGAAKYADKLTRPSESPARGRKPSNDISPGREPSQAPLNTTTTQTRPLASPTSPHLLPSPASSSRKTVVSLGWSDTAKHSFDHAQSPPHSPLRRRAPQTCEHVATPARPLNECVAHVREDSLTRRPSILSGLMESWNERKAERRREDLRRIIKVVTPAHLEAQEDEVAGATRRPSLFAAVSWRSGG